MLRSKLIPLEKPIDFFRNFHDPNAAAPAYVVAGSFAPASWLSTYERIPP